MRIFSVVRHAKIKLPMVKDHFLRQLTEVIEEFERLQSAAQYSDLSDVLTDKVEDLTTLITKAKAAIARTTGVNSEYYKDVIKSLEAPREHTGTRLRLIMGTVRALKSDLESGYLQTLHEIVQTEIFSDYLEMATYLIKEGFKDASAVIVGSTLEAHLRELCKANQIEIEVHNSKGNIVAKRADLLNADLAKKEIYSTAYQKQITAWLDLRNSAAHGHYSEYSTEQIKLMLEGVRQFILITT
jgi:hypothetical protein